MTSIEKFLQERKASIQDALQIYDSLEPATIELLTGRWKGYEIKTGHSMEGLLVPSGWYGKLFKSPNEVHPLLFYANKKTELYAVNPKLIPLNMNFPKSNFLQTIMAITKPVLQTKKFKARMRMMEFRGKFTATMIYDEKPIFDHFAKIDDNTLLGVMDLKINKQPYFFVLERDNQEYKFNF